MDKLAQEDHSCCPSSEKYERYRKNWYISLNKSGRNAPMKLRSDFRTAVTMMNRLHRESGEERPAPIPFHQYKRWHSSSFSITSWRQWNENWWSFFFFKKKNVVARSFPVDGNLLQPTEGVNSTTHTSPFLVFARMCNCVSQGTCSRLKCLCASCHPCFMRLCV